MYAVSSSSACAIALATLTTNMDAALVLASLVGIVFAGIFVINRLDTKAPIVAFKRRKSAIAGWAGITLILAALIVGAYIAMYIAAILTC